MEIVSRPFFPGHQNQRLSLTVLQSPFLSRGDCQAIDLLEPGQTHQVAGSCRRFFWLGCRVAVDSGNG
jgi:hypothetical protein